MFLYQQLGGLSVCPFQVSSTVVVGKILTRFSHKIKGKPKDFRIISCYISPCDRKNLTLSRLAFYNLRKGYQKVWR